MAEKTNVIEEIRAERQRQIDVEGWSAEHDDQHNNGEIAKAAACYASGNPHGVSYWPWHRDWWKPKSRRRDLIRAAALIVAEIDRIDRKEQNDG